MTIVSLFHFQIYIAHIYMYIVRNLMLHMDRLLYTSVKTWLASSHQLIMHTHIYINNVQGQSVLDV